MLSFLILDLLEKLDEYLWVRPLLSSQTFSDIACGSKVRRVEGEPKMRQITFSAIWGHLKEDFNFSI